MHIHYDSYMSKDCIALYLVSRGGVIRKCSPQQVACILPCPHVYMIDLRTHAFRKSFGSRLFGCDGSTLYYPFLELSGVLHARSFDCV